MEDKRSAGVECYDCKVKMIHKIGIAADYYKCPKCEIELDVCQDCGNTIDKGACFYCKMD